MSDAARRPRVMMVGPHLPATGGLANNMSLLQASSLADRFEILSFSTTKRRQRVMPSRPYWDSGPYLVHHAALLFTRILKQQPDIVYLKATSDTGFIRDMTLMRIARGLGKPVLCHLHGRPMGRLFDPRGGGWVRLTRRGLRLSEATITLSPGLARQFEGMFPGQPLIPVPNVVDLDRFGPGGHGRALDRPLRVLTVGRVSTAKGTWDLLRVARAVADAGVDVEFRLCGTGETAAEEAALREEAARLGLQESVRFLGVVKNEGLVAEYRDADVFFLPTHAEIFPNVVLEALASGLPVVTTNVPVIPEMFTEGVEGHLHPPRDVAGMTASLLRLEKEEPRRAAMGSAARTLAETRYAVEGAARTIGDLLEQILDGRPFAPGARLSDSPPGSS